MLKPTPCAVVDDLKALGLSSPRIEAIVLSLVDDVWQSSVGEEPVDDIRVWCIQRYYGTRNNAG